MRWSTAFAPLFAVAGLLSTAAAAADGTLTFADGDKFTFTYKTSAPKAKNWIGIYHTTGGPEDEKQHDPSLSWIYAPSASGSVQIPAPVRASGQYKAFFLADDGYKWLANPITFTPRSRNPNPTNELRIMSYNLWNGGVNINGYHAKQVRYITDSGADIVGLQEASGSHAQRLANALGWNFHQPGSGDTAAIISRHPIVKRHSKVIDRSNGATINIDSNSARALNFWSIHTTAYPYGPYEACYENATADQISKAEADSGRVGEVTSVLSGTKAQRDSSTPFILVGDFNAPSHLDWVSSTSSTHCGKTFSWPTSKLCTDAGLTDSFRKVNPDPKSVPGNTWSPIEKQNTEYNKPEIQDRIDFVYHKAGWTVLNSQVKVAGTPKPKPDHVDNEWTSDHAAVLTTYRF